MRRQEGGSRPSNKVKTLDQKREGVTNTGERGGTRGLLVVIAHQLRGKFSINVVVAAGWRL